MQDTRRLIWSLSSAGEKLVESTGKGPGRDRTVATSATLPKSPGCGVTQSLTRPTKCDLPRWEIKYQLNQSSAHVRNFNIQTTEYTVYTESQNNRTGCAFEDKFE